MSENHCIDSRCATLWVKKRDEYISVRGDYVKFRYQGDPYYYYADARSFIFRDEASVRCYFGADENLRSSIPLAIANNPPENEMPSTLPYDIIPDGTWTGERQDVTYDDRRFFQGDKGEIKIHSHFDESIIYWQGNVDYAFISTYQSGDDFLYDVNICEPGTYAITQAISGRNYNADSPNISNITTFPPYYSYLSFVEFNGKIYDRLARPGYAESNRETTRYSQQPIDSSLRPIWVEIVNPINVKIPPQWSKHEIEKLPWLEKIEVVPYYYNYEFGGFINPFKPRGEIPRHCLNVYLTNTQGNVLSGLLSPGNPSFSDATELILQFCGDDPGKLEPPDYVVQCKCQEKCPEDTCSVECIDHYCCYNSQGKAIKEIEKLLPPS